jgi:hypothetical protein
MPDIEKEPNYLGYLSLLESETLFNEYKGQYVAFVDGKLVDHDPNEHTLSGRVNEMYKNQAKLVAKVDKNIESVSCISILKAHEEEVHL